MPSAAPQRGVGRPRLARAGRCSDHGSSRLARTSPSTIAGFCGSSATCARHAAGAICSAGTPSRSELAGRAGQQARQRAQERRLAGAGRADDVDDLARCNGERDAVEHARRAGVGRHRSRDVAGVEERASLAPALRVHELGLVAVDLGAGRWRARRPRSCTAARRLRARRRSPRRCARAPRPDARRSTRRPARSRARRAAGSRPPPSSPAPSSRDACCRACRRAPRCRAARGRPATAYGVASARRARVAASRTHDEAPRLLVAGRRRRHRGAQQHLDLLVGDGRVGELADAAAGVDRVEQVHGPSSSGQPSASSVRFAAAVCGGDAAPVSADDGAGAEEQVVLEGDALERDQLAGELVDVAGAPRASRASARAGRRRRAAPSSSRARTSSTSPRGCAASTTASRARRG